MALHPCHECGHNISSEAKSCPQCGARPRPKTTTATKVVGGFFILVVAYAVFRPASDQANTGVSPETPKYPIAEISTHARSLVRASSKDPESLKFQNEFTPQPGVSCGEVNGKNSFGAYVGFKRYIAQGKTALIDDASARNFDGAWREFCQPTAQSGTST